MNRYFVLLLLLFFQPALYGQVSIELNRNDILLNGFLLNTNPDKNELDSLVGEKSSVVSIIRSYNATTKETDRQKRRSFRYKASGIWIEYYANEKNIYSITLFMKSSNRKPEKDNLITYPNMYKDGTILLDSSSSMDQTLKLLDKQSVRSIGMRPYLPEYKIPSIIYKKNDFYIELMFHPETKLIKQIYIIKR